MESQVAVVNENRAALPTVAPRQDMNQIMMSKEGFGNAWRFCQAIASSDFAPKAYRGKPENVLGALCIADALRCNVYMLMPVLYFVHGSPGFLGQFAISQINQRGPYVGGLRYEFEYDKQGNVSACTCSGKRRDGSLDELRISMELVKANGWLSNQKWKTMPEQMLRYRTAAWLARAHCPEVLLGYHFVDELEDTYRIEVGPAYDSEPLQISDDADALTEELNSLVIEGEETDVVPEKQKAEK